VGISDALLVIAPEHARVFHDAGWSKATLLEKLRELLKRPGHELVVGAGGIAEGLPPSLRKETLEKFRPGGLCIVRAGGGAGMVSAIVGGWVGWGAWPAARELGSSPVNRRIET
jgi:hypothetical protein